MLLDNVVHSIRRFKTDCQALCLQHYPAVHNGGLTSIICRLRSHVVLNLISNSKV